MYLINQFEVCDYYCQLQYPYFLHFGIYLGFWFYCILILGNWNIFVCIVSFNISFLRFIFLDFVLDIVKGHLVWDEMMRWGVWYCEGSFGLRWDDEVGGMILWRVIWFEMRWRGGGSDIVKGHLVWDEMMRWGVWYCEGSFGLRWDDEVGGLIYLQSFLLVFWAWIILNYKNCQIWFGWLKCVFALVFDSGFILEIEEQILIFLLSYLLYIIIVFILVKDL